MKKSFIVALACSFFAVGAVNAQTETYYGGKNGSFALSIGADPVIDFVGNMFNSSTDNYLNGLGGTLAGKYYVSDKFAVAAELGIDNMKSTSFTYNPEDEDYEEGFDFGDEETTIYEVKCACGSIINFDEETLEEGSMNCPNCGELLEFSVEDDEDEDEE